MHYNFEWDPQKEKENIKKYKVSFSRAAGIFLDPFMLSIYDNRHSTTEDRWITLGKDSNDIHIVFVHTFREVNSQTSVIRRISSRKAAKNEIKQYLKR